MNHKKEITVSFTGHRDYKDFASDALETLLRRLYAEGYRNFLCGMARGFDLAAGECVAGLRSEMPDMRLVCVIPFRGQERSFSQADQVRFRNLTEQADEAIYLSEGYWAGAYHQRNDFLTENASVIVAYYNGTRGGTHYTLHRAVKQGLRIFNICSCREGELFNNLK